MKQIGLPLEDLPTVHLARPSVAEQYREAAQTLDNLRPLVRRQPSSEAEKPVDQRRFNIPPNGNPELFERAS